MAMESGQMSPADIRAVMDANGNTVPIPVDCFVYPVIHDFPNQMVKSCRIR